jgi:hypothetical protein
MRALSVMVLVVATGLGFADEKENYRFPRGVPVNGAEVTWYLPTDDYQFQGGVHDRRYNISAAKPSERFGNANLEFPWRTGGIDESQNVASYKFYRLPPDRAILARLQGDHYRWEYPDGTLFGELLQVDGRTFEVRTMRKAEGEWDFRIYRPFARRREVEPFILKEEWWRQTLANAHSVSIINESALVNAIELSEKGVNEVLSRPFRDVTDLVWFESDEGEKCYAPSALKLGGIVPVDYQGGFLHGQTCAKCHNTVGMDASQLQPGRDWYGKVRGSDSVFSFSIFEPGSASGNGYNRPVVLDRQMLEAGLLKRGD